MFIEQSIRPENKFWKYIVGLIMVVVASAIGQVPLLIAVIYKSMQDGNGMPMNELALMKTLDSNTTLFLLLLASAFAILGLHIVLKTIHKQSFLSVVTSRKKTDWKRIFFSFTLWAVFSIVTVLATYIASPEDFVINFKVVPFLLLLIISIIMVPIQTSSEELIFRGYLMQGIGGLVHNRWLPLLLTSAIFGLLHIANPEVAEMGYIIMVYYIGTGLILGIMTLMDEGLELALGFHAANNLVGALLVTADWSVFQTHAIFRDISEPSAGVDIILPVVIVYPVLLFIFSKKYNWSDWKEKLTGTIVPNPLITKEHETHQTHG